MKKFNKIVASVLAVSMLSGTALSLAACKKSGDAYTYNIWLGGNENAQYTDYNDNLAVKYLNTLQFEGEDGEMHDVNLNFITAASMDAARDNFNTMVGTGNFYDVMDLSQTSYTAKELYEDGMLIDLTPYLTEKNCMPNYMSWLKANPYYAKTAVDDVSGQKKYLQIYGYHDTIEAWGGWQYRRDWIAKYGKDKDGNAFTYSYENGILKDNIVFPSYYNESLRNSYNALLKSNGLKEWDGTDPAFVSDWEWMLGIFKTALIDKGVPNGNSPSGETGYPMGIYYPGFVETGELICAFGGDSADFYADKNGTVHYGITEGHFKEYLKMMNGWYNNGWIDTEFNTRSSDMWYQVDNRNMYSGRVGLFYGNGNTPMNKLASDNQNDKFTYGYYAAPARQPINDVYGTEYKYVAGTNEFLPRTFFMMSKEQASCGLTTKLDGKDVEALLRAIDHLYEYSYKDENGVLQAGGCMLATGGLTKEQYDKVGKSGDYYSRATINGKSIAETGAIGLNEAGTEFVFMNGLGAEDNLRNPAFINRFVGLQPAIDRGRQDYQQHVFDEWSFYSSSRFNASFTAQLDPADSEKYNSLLDNVRSDVKTAIPELIKAKTFSDTDYSKIIYTVTRRGTEDMKATLQKLYDKFYK